jgi:alginate production protein
MDRLEVGMRVEAQGRVLADKFRATRVVLKAGGSDELEVRAPVEGDWGEDPVASFHSGKLSLLGHSILPGGDLAVRGAETLAELLAEAKNGKWVKVEGEKKGGVIIVSEITLRDPTAGDPRVEGKIEARQQRAGDRVKIDVGGLEVIVDRNTSVTVEASPDALAPAKSEGELASFVDDDDATPRGLRLFSGRLEVGGQLDGSIDPESDLDLDERQDADETEGRLSGRLEAHASLGPGLEALAEASLTRVKGLQEPAGVDLDRTSFEVREAHLTFGRKIRRWRTSLVFRVGRQDFDEPREWLYDENLDAVRLALQTGFHLNIEAALAVTNERSVTGDTYGFLVLSQDVLSRFGLWGYAILRNAPPPAFLPESGATSQDDARWYGLRSLGDFVDGIEHWVECSWIRGDDRAGSRDRKHRGKALDFGVTVEPLDLTGNRNRLLRLRPKITLGWARGTGDRAETRDRDEAYHQTPFADNNDKFGGVTSFRYYGEVLNPELRNLEVRTAALGLRVRPSTSVDVVFHDYRQHVADDRVRGSDIDCGSDEPCQAPSGLDRRLGQGFDVVVGYEEIRNVELELVYAFFEPRNAYEDVASRATKMSLQLRYKF